VCQKTLVGLTLLFAACSTDDGDPAAQRGSPVEAGADRAVQDSKPAMEAGPDRSHPETGAEACVPDGNAPECASDAPDVDAPDADAGIACGKLQAAWLAFVAANRACETNADCVVVGGTGTCDCGPSLGEASGDAISKSASEGAGLYFDRYNECIASGHHFGCTFDAGPARNLRCKSGTCTADLGFCGWDGG